MASPDLPREAAELLHSASELLSSAGPPAPETLGQLVRLAASEVPGCSGASATLWQDGEPAVFAASHPDLAELATIERSAGCGPVTEARAAGKLVCTQDTLHEDRWPGYAAAALSRGVRSSVTLVHHSGPVVVTLSLFGARPGQPGLADQPLARLAGVFGGAARGRAARLRPAEVPPPGATGN
ncbi:MAG: hypothetical protein JWL68_5673 [Actinomycetia bacterium]|nr:hypothetical protein [Actinomycetes bacterium]